MQTVPELRERIARYTQLLTQLGDPRAVRAIRELCAEYEGRIVAIEAGERDDRAPPAQPAARDEH